MFRHALIPVALAGWLAVALAPAVASACPFCVAASQTLSEEIGSADVVLFAKLVEVPKQPGADDADAAQPGSGEAQTDKTRFRIVEVLKGKEHLADLTELAVVYFGQADTEAVFFVTGLGAPSIEWTTPLRLSAAAETYIRRLPQLPAKRPDQLEFFQDFFEHEDPMLAQDAYDEFARSPYQDVIAMKDRMKHDSLVQWIQDADIAPSRRRLYLTMLGVCGGPGDLPMLEKMISSKDRKEKMGLDAMIACYLILKGPDGLTLIEDLFLKNPDAEYQDTYAAVMALRFHGQETSVIERPRLLESMRHLLDHPELADQIIPDLARWEDWSVMDRLVELFKNSDEKSSWVRVPVINYLRKCGDAGVPESKKALASIDELAAIDPESVERANAFLAFGGFGAGKPAAATATETEAAETAASETSTETKAAVSDAGAAVEPGTEAPGQPATTVADGATASSDTTAAEPQSEPAATASDAAAETASTDTDPQNETSPENPPAGDAADDPQPVLADATSAAGPGAPSESNTLATPSRLLIVAVPMVGGILLFGLLWWILRRTGSQTAS